MVNTLAYYDTAIITAVKCFILQVPVLQNVLLPYSMLYCNTLECLPLPFASNLV